MTQMKRILPLADTPKNCRRILQWCPFKKGESLQDIVNNHNSKCKQFHESSGWVCDDIEEMMSVVQVVAHDLSRVDKLREDDFETIYILLIDLDVIKGRDKELARIRHYMSRRRHEYYLVQVSKYPNVRSLAAFFDQMPIYPYPLSFPQILHNQEEFEKLLWYFCMPWPPPPDTGGDGNGEGKQEYLQAISKVGDDVRHTTIMRNLSKEETFALAHRAIQQEFSLARIEGLIRPQIGHHVILDAIREPVFKMPVEQPDLQQVELIHACPARSMRELTSEQRRIFHTLGVRGTTYTAVNFDMPSTWDLIDRLGSAVEVSKFSAALPFSKVRG